MAEHVMEGWLSELRSSRPWTEDEARRVIDAWKTSGRTVAAFAREAGLKADRVYWWRERLAAAATSSGIQVRDEQPSVAPSFVPVVVRTVPAAEPSGGSVPVTVCIRDRLRVEVAELDVASAAWVATLVRSLEGVPS